MERHPTPMEQHPRNILAQNKKIGSQIDTKTLKTLKTTCLLNNWGPFQNSKTF
jgi:hypothetical protein